MILALNISDIIYLGLCLYMSRISTISKPEKTHVHPELSLVYVPSTPHHPTSAISNMLMSLCWLTSLTKTPRCQKIGRGLH
jgi:hypothetical protein